LALVVLYMQTARILFLALLLLLVGVVAQLVVQPLLANLHHLAALVVVAEVQLENC
jgi:hypothetical protein